MRNLRERPAPFTCGKRRTRRRMDNARQDGQDRTEKLRRTGLESQICSPSGGLGLSIPYREKRRTNRPTAKLSRGAGGQTIHPPERSAERVRRSPHGRGDGPRHDIGRPRKSSHTPKRGRPRREVGRGRSTPTTSRNAADLRRRFDPPKNLYVKIRGARRNLRASLICPSRAPGPWRSAYKLTIPAAWLMRGVMPFARKCADQCTEAADSSKLE